MRTFDLCGANKFQRTTIHTHSEKYIDRNHHSRNSCVVTKLGIVMINEFRWEHNLGIDVFSKFCAVLDGVVHYAYINEAPLSERQRKWLATNFIKKAKLNQL